MTVVIEVLFGLIVLAAYIYLVVLCSPYAWKIKHMVAFLNWSKRFLTVPDAEMRIINDDKR